MKLKELPKAYWCFSSTREIQIYQSHPHFLLYGLLLFPWIITWSPSHQHKHHLASFYISSWDLKIFSVQSRVLKVCANAYNIKVLPISIWKLTIPKICWLTRPTYKNWALCPLHHASGFLPSSSMTFLTMVLSQLLIPFLH